MVAATAASSDIQPGDRIWTSYHSSSQSWWVFCDPNHAFGDIIGLSMCLINRHWWELPAWFVHNKLSLVEFSSQLGYLSDELEDSTHSSHCLQKMGHKFWQRLTVQSEICFPEWPDQQEDDQLHWQHHILEFTAATTSSVTLILSNYSYASVNSWSQQLSTSLNSHLSPWWRRRIPQGGREMYAARGVFSEHMVSICVSGMLLQIRGPSHFEERSLIFWVQQLNP